MFVDTVKIHIKAGNGGDGCVSFHRAKYVPNGGPDGGDGGKGGDLVFTSDNSMATLMDFRYKRSFAAQPGENGAGRNCSGKKGADVEIRVPVGTIIREASTQRIMADLTEAGQSVTLIRGGKGGRGNQHFATPTRQAPRYAEPGRKAKAYDVVLELKLLADVGLVGLPNVGKSSLLKAATNANPKIADYHFTTLSPNLGVVRRTNDGNDFVLADIPGIIEGASTGAGLGHTFLRHIQRTRVLVHVVDASCVLDPAPDKPLADIRLIQSELSAYDSALLGLAQVVAANKMDVASSQDALEHLQNSLEPEGISVFPVSAATGSGLNSLLAYISTLLEKTPHPQPLEADYFTHAEVLPESIPFEVTRLEDGSFSVEGPAIERMLGYTNLETEKGFVFFQKFLRERGILARLEELGAEEGDTVRLYDLQFEYLPS